MIVGLEAGGAAGVTVLVFSQMPLVCNVVEEGPESAGVNLSTNLLMTVKRLAQTHGAGCVTAARLGVGK